MEITFMGYNPDHYITKLGNTKWYAIDLDGTLAYSVWNKSRGIGEPIKENVEKLYRVRDKGFKIVIHTARPSFDYEAIERWLNDHGIPWDKIETGKLLAHRYVDDKAIAASRESWLD